MKRLGQHFLRNAAVADKIASALGVGAGDAVIEIGSGHGELTRRIVKASAGAANITVLEKDARLAAALVRDLPAVTVKEGDALRLLPSAVSEMGGASWKLVGNIPYYITGKLLRLVSELPHKPERTILMVQDEVAERLSAKPPHMNRLAASVQFWADATIIARVPKGDFSPPPEVDSAVVLLALRENDGDVGQDRYYSAVRAVFSQPRKTILNNVAAHADKSREFIEKTLAQAGINASERPQDLAIDNVATIAKLFF